MRFPFHDFLDMTRPVPVRDPDSGADDAGCLDLELGNLDARYRSIAVEFGPLRQVENLLGDVFGSQVQCFFTGEGDRFHSALPSHASSMVANGSGSAKR